MSFAPPDGPLSELTTTRVGGGRSARLMALAVSACLMGVVAIAVIGQPAPPAPAATPSPPTDRLAVVVPMPAPTPSPPRTQLEGNDGIFGWAVVAQLASYRMPRGPGLFNRCRWDVGPQAARPLGTHDEASCPG